MSSPEQLAREKIDKLLTDCGSSLVTYHLSLSFIPTIQRLYSMLRSIFFSDRNTDDVGCDQREETGNTPFAFSKGRNVINLASI
jgi:hypothetical protein